MTASAYRALADGVLALHVAFVVYVVIGLALILTGGVLRWSWVRNPWFRWSHLAAIGIVVAQAWLGVICPLTTLEMHFRARAGAASHEGSFIAYWVEELLYIDAPPLAFTLAYTLFGIAVLSAWRFVPPRPFRAPNAVHGRAAPR